jgi:prophage regulatory protein
MQQQPSLKPEFSRPHSIHQLPETGYLRIFSIIGNPKANPPIPAIVPVSRSTWLNWEKSGKAPKSIKLGERVTVWRVEDVIAFIEKLGETETAGGV